MNTAASNKRLERTRHGRASLLSCVGEPLKRNVRRIHGEAGGPIKDPSLNQRTYHAKPRAEEADRQ